MLSDTPTQYLVYCLDEEENRDVHNTVSAKMSLIIMLVLTSCSWELGKELAY